MATADGEDAIAFAPTHSLVCCITGERMTDPVVDPEGNTYERAAIEEWLTRNQTSPVTRNPLQANQLVVNRALLAVLESSADAPMAEEATVLAETEPAATYGVQRDPAYLYAMHDNGSRAACSYTMRIRELEGGPLEGGEGHDNDSSAAVMARVLVAVVDVSGSMGTNVEMVTASARETTRLTRLDLVAHALKAIVTAMDDAHSFALVPFSTGADVTLPMCRMTPANKRRAIDAIEAMRPNGQTNVWAGVRRGAKLFEGLETAAVGTLEVFTDGEANLNPKGRLGAEPEEYRRLRATLAHGPIALNVYGFGSGITPAASAMLDQLANAGDGTYCSIPDPNAVATTFSNMAANALTSVSTAGQARVELHLLDETTTRLVPLGRRWTHHGNGRFSCELPALRVGQPATLVWEVVAVDPPSGDGAGANAPAHVTVRNVRLVVGGAAGDPVVDVPGKPADTPAAQACVLGDHHRVGAAIMYRRIAKGDGPMGADYSDLSRRQHQVREYLAALERVVERAEALGDALDVGVLDRLRGMREDVVQQVTLAVSRADYFSRWGISFLRMLACAYDNQLCTDFKNPGVQHFGGVLTRDLRERIEEIFCDLPAPQPRLDAPPLHGGVFSFRGGATRGGGGGGTHQSAMTMGPPITMRSFSQPNNPCVAEGSTLVRVLEAKGAGVGGGHVRCGVERLRPGDLVRASAADPTATARVACVVRTRVVDWLTLAVAVAAHDAHPPLRITPWHPVVDHASGAWAFPAELPATFAQQRVYVRFLYSIVTEEGRGVLVDGHECITLGHAVAGDRVAAHPYLGGRGGEAGRGRVYDDLRRLPQWARGEVRMRAGWLVRDPASRLIDGMRADHVDHVDDDNDNLGVGDAAEAGAAGWPCRL
jgi:Mg-chelatase subunit ChlD